MNSEPSLGDARIALGITADATAAEVASAFRRLARAAHPDVDGRPDAASRFDALVAAYRTALPAAAADERVGAGGGTRAQDGRAPFTAAPSRRAVHEVSVDASGTLVWEAGRPVIFVSATVHEP